MKTSVNFQYILKNREPEAAVKLVKNAGFAAIDFGFLTEEYYAETGLGEDWYRQLRCFANHNGIVFNQAHAPYPTSFKDPAKTAVRFWEVVRAMKHAAILGIPVMVVHPMQHLRYYDDGAPELLFEMNMDFYRRLIPFCEEYGVKVALENMWQREPENVINHSTCSTPAEMIRYHDTLNSPWITCCLDLGHATLVEDTPAFIRALGADRLRALHVHDVDGIHDSHMPPYTGVTNWTQIAKALKDIGYRGDFTFEVCAWTNKLPMTLHEPALKLLSDIGHHLVNQITE
ncbi:MAG: sugar phosphate isomerase/epimerase [Oscillospiraceae bacterium]|nr:sugar phosphate isomerase/epimerase [Oscillospiraceae bacterium]